jgi:ribonucleoside-diphosphate reductase alpha chain
LAEQRELFIRAHRRKLPSERASITHKFSIGGHEGYITVGMYETGEPAEIFIKMAKEGSTLSGFMDGFALSVSMGLQYGVPLKALVDKFINTRFEPAGYTGHPAIPYAKSVLDYIARWLGGRFISAEYLTQTSEGGLPVATLAMPVISYTLSATAHVDRPSQSADSRPMFDGAPTCSECGMLMTPNGACYKCENCGGTSGCS